MADIDDGHQEPGLGAFVRLAVQNAINNKIDDDEIHDHFAHVTGHDPENDWNNFPRLLTQAFQGEERVGEMVRALGFHEDNFAEHFRQLKDDKQATADLRDEIHEAASFVGESIGVMVDNVRAATKDDASAAYEAAYDFADTIHATHAVHDDLFPEAAHSMSQLQLKNYRSPVTFLKPDQIGGVWGRLRKGASKVASGARRAVSKVSKAVVPRRVRGLFGPEDSTMAIGGRDSTKQLHIEPNQLVAISFVKEGKYRTGVLPQYVDVMEEYALNRARISKFGVAVELSQNRTASIDGNFAEFALKRDKYLGFTFTPTGLRVKNTIGRVAMQDPSHDVSLGKFANPSSYNVFMYHDRSSVTPSAFGAIFTLSPEKKVFRLIPGSDIEIEVTVNIEAINGVRSSLSYVVKEKKFNPAKRRPVRMASLINANLSESMHERLTAAGYVKDEELGQDSEYGTYHKGNDYFNIDNRGMIMGTTVGVDGNWVMAEEGQEYSAFDELDSFSLDDESAPLLPPREEESNSSIFAAMKNSTIIAIQIKKRTTRDPYYPWLTLFVSRPPTGSDSYEIQGAMLVRPVPSANKPPLSWTEKSTLKKLEGDLARQSRADRKVTDRR